MKTSETRSSTSATSTTARRSNTRQAPRAAAAALPPPAQLPAQAQPKHQLQQRLQHSWRILSYRSCQAYLHLFVSSLANGINVVGQVLPINALKTSPGEDRATPGASLLSSAYCLTNCPGEDLTVQHVSLIRNSRHQQEQEQPRLQEQPWQQQQPPKDRRHRQFLFATSTANISNAVEQKVPTNGHKTSPGEAWDTHVASLPHYVYGLRTCPGEALNQQRFLLLLLLKVPPPWIKTNHSRTSLCQMEISRWKKSQRSSSNSPCLTYKPSSARYTSTPQPGPSGLQQQQPTQTGDSSTSRASSRTRRAPDRYGAPLPSDLCISGSSSTDSSTEANRERLQQRLNDAVRGTPPRQRPPRPNDGKGGKARAKSP